MIYFDNASTTKVNDEVITLYTKLLHEYFANPSNDHEAGFAVFNLVEKARKSILEQFDVADKRLIFTSGATEANNLFLIGAFLRYKNRGNKIIISKGEHASVRHTCAYLSAYHGAEVLEVNLLPDGRVDTAHLATLLSKDTVLVSIIAINNETGAVNDLAEISRLVREYKTTLLHSDVTQAIGKFALPYNELDSFSFSAHKFHGLKGSGALILNNNLTLEKVTHGGGQEYGMRSGTNNAPLNIVLSRTIRLAMANINEKRAHVHKLVTPLYAFLEKHNDYFMLNSSIANPFIVNFSLQKHRASIFKNALSKAGIMVSSTSACSDKLTIISPAVFAMTNDVTRASNTVRVSFSEYNNASEVEKMIEVLTSLMGVIRRGL